MESDELHRERGADVRAQDHRQGLAKAHESRAYEPDEHDRGGARGLDEARDERPGTHGCQPVAGKGAKKRADLRARRILESVVQEVDAVEKEEYPAEKAYKDHSVTMPNFCRFVKIILIFFRLDELYGMRS